MHDGWLLFATERPRAAALETQALRPQTGRNATTDLRRAATTLQQRTCTDNLHALSYGINKASVETALTKKRIMLVDDHPIVRSGLSEVINRCDDLEVVAEASDAESALMRLELGLPDLVIADISLPAMNGIELTKSIRERFPALPVLIVSMHEEALYAERALRAGARGYVTKLEPPEVLLNAARGVLEGEVFISKRTATRLLKTMIDTRQAQNSYMEKTDRIASLTDRELEVFEAIGSGLTARELADRLNRSVKTVETHRTNIISKLGLPGSAALRECATSWIASGRRSGTLTPPNAAGGQDGTRAPLSTPPGAGAPPPGA